MKLLFKYIAPLAASAALAWTGGAAQAASYSFTQGGFNGGGSVLASFVGVDRDLNNVIDASFGEVSGFSLSFSGGTGMAAFTATQEDLAGLLFRLGGDGVLGNDGAPGTGEGLAVITFDGLEYLSGIGPQGSAGAAITDLATGRAVSTSAPLQLSAVPEPASAGLLLAGLGLIGLVRRPRR